MLPRFMAVLPGHCSDQLQSLSPFWLILPNCSSPWEGCLWKNNLISSDFVRYESVYDGHGRETCINMVLVIGIPAYIVKGSINRLKISPDI